MLLEKIVLLVVSYFSVGTEMRFLNEKKKMENWEKLHNQKKRSMMED